MKRVKICGLTHYEDAKLALELGAWALGFIFYEKSPRFIEPRRAASLLRELQKNQAEHFNSVLRVGVFVDQDVETIATVVRDAALNAVQLHGHETPEYCEVLKSRVPSVQVFKALRPHTLKDVDQARDFTGCDALLVDAFTPGLLGGTGIISNWPLAEKLTHLEKPVILSGGLRAENVVDAAERVKPYGFDLSSSLENSPGVKSPEKMHQFFEALRRVK